LFRSWRGGCVVIPLDDKAWESVPMPPEHSGPANLLRRQPYAVKAARTVTTGGMGKHSLAVRPVPTHYPRHRAGPALPRPVCPAAPPSHAPFPLDRGRSGALPRPGRPGPTLEDDDMTRPRVHPVFPAARVAPRVPQ